MAHFAQISSVLPALPGTSFADALDSLGGGKDDVFVEKMPVAEHLKSEHHHTGDYRGQLTSAIDARAYIRAGNATITLKSSKTGNHFTYKVRASEDGNCHFVSVLNGPDNWTNYKYIGRIARDVFWAGRKTPRPGDIAKTAPSVVAFAWAWQHLAQESLPGALEIWHEGSCGRCGRKLTVPASVARGLGPECAGKAT